jgi:hypothetical protein
VEGQLLELVVLKVWQVVLQLAAQQQAEMVRGRKQHTGLVLQVELVQDCKQHTGLVLQAVTVLADHMLHIRLVGMFEQVLVH